MPEIGIVEIIGVDLDGEMQGRAIGVAGEVPDIVVIAERGAPALGVGERAVARFSHTDANQYEARILRAVGGAPDRVIGVYRAGREGGRIEPTDRKVRT
ncbi:MAG: ribonuclease R, partial [Stellaceae bacterium]